ncbi:response regulator [Synechocystis sp. LKSZ1]|uniref:response regulator n=1 Tax=Synechocystis sp. LKSZ1 TaxID=3144951 RepID=UPI00336BEE37
MSSPQRILVVDDEEDIRSIIQLALTLQTPWQVLLASSGPEALSLAKTQQPDLILLDRMMPGMDGPSTLQQLKAHPQTQSIPVLLMTAAPLPPETLTALGAVGILPKPFRPLQLAQQLQAILGEAPTA